MDCTTGPIPSRNFDQLSVVVCARNEARTVAQVLSDLRRSLPGAEILLVDNASSDETAKLAASVPGVIVLQQPLPGKGHAMRMGAERATKEWLLFHDADGEYCAQDCADVVSAAQASSWALGVRLVGYQEILPSSWAANALVGALLRVRTGLIAQDILTGTRCLRRDEFIALNTQAEGFAIETEITRKMLSLQRAPAHVGVRFVPRSKAQGKKIRAYHLIGLIREALR